MTGGTGGASEGGTGGTTGGVCNLACVQGKHCELVQVTCVRAPCPPVPNCVDDAKPAPGCGGFAGIACPGLGDCGDDPSDGCDPKMGGADCPGVCACNAVAKCTGGMVWNSTPAVCACETPGSGPVCGAKTCAVDQECCNASCGICTAPGGVCTKELCN